MDKSIYNYNQRLRRKQYGLSEERKKKDIDRSFRWYKENYDKVANRNLKYLYGITLDQKREMWLQQWRLCAICCDDIPTLKEAQVDHNHVTGEVRAIICHDCNVSLGKLKENKQTVMNMYDYLVNWNESIENGNQVTR